ncbi:OmpH family outer membrane protein [candidate division KSB1 bacterium]|nr:OmpH family outer membrane protein [candidate division KSB1 bacterium]
MINKRMFFGAIILGLFCLTLTGSAFAQLKTGYVNSQAVLAQYQPAIDAQKKLEAEAAKWAQELGAMETDIRSTQERLEQQSLMLSDVKKEELQQEIQNKMMQYQQFQNEKWGEQGEFARRRAELLQPIIDKINTVIQDVGDAGGYDYIFDTVAGNLLYAQEKHDVTEAILAELNKQ